MISILGQASRPIFKILTHNWIFKTNSKWLALGRSSWKANGLCEVQELWSDAVIWSAGGASDRPSLIMNDRSDIYRCYKSSCFNYQGPGKLAKFAWKPRLLHHDGLNPPRLPTFKVVWKLCTKPKPNVNYFVVGVLESLRLKFSLVTMMKRKVICKALSGWGPIEGYWGGSDWLPRFFCSQTLYRYLPFTQPTTASSALPAFRSGMRCDNTKYIYSSLVFPTSCPQLKSSLYESTPIGSCHIQQSTNDSNSSVVLSIIN